MSSSPVLSSVTSDAELMAEIQSRSKKTLTSHSEYLHECEMKLSHNEYKSVLEGNYLGDPDAQGMAEAIILLDGRPSLLITDDTFDEPTLDYWKTRLNPYRAALSPTIRSVGRIELTGHSTYEWVGTGWVIADRLIATNRHVANLFGQRRGQGFVFRQNEYGKTISAKIDFKEEFAKSAATAEKEIPINRILYIAPDQEGQPDMAILEMAEHAELPQPIPVASSTYGVTDAIAVIGYPAYDTRNGEDAMRDIFREIYNVKRFAPGKIMPSADALAIQHDCSTLGGNSGSAVVNIQSGEVLGLHFGGKFRTRNYAVKSEIIRRIMSQLPSTKTTMVVGFAPEGPSVASLANREGYRADFLGSGKRVRLPSLTADQEEDAVPVPERSDYVLPYTHFSVVMCQSRRLSYFTAVNIDGDQSINLRRSGAWALDPRIPAEMQCGDEIYQGNKLDKGHMVRRLDPVWGSPDIAKKANNDTFLYTNACPQHALLNQGTWNELENYILNNTDERNMKVSVFTGPVLKTSDPAYRGIKIPQEYWKVVAMVKPNGKLSATAYMLSQSQLMDDLELPEFQFGAFQTFQVTISKIEEETKLSFGSLKDFDPLSSSEFERTVIAISSPQDLVL